MTKTVDPVPDLLLVHTIFILFSESLQYCYVGSMSVRALVLQVCNVHSGKTNNYQILTSKIKML